MIIPNLHQFGALRHHSHYTWRVILRDARMCRNHSNEKTKKNKDDVKKRLQPYLFKYPAGILSANEYGNIKSE
jgi:hypothetical protein